MNSDLVERQAGERVVAEELFEREGQQVRRASCERCKVNAHPLDKVLCFCAGS